MSDFNVVVTLRADFGRALHALRAFGRVRRTRFYNVLLLQVEDPEAFLEALRERLESDPGLRASLARVEPLERTFVFTDADELEARLKETLSGWLPKLRGHSFHVRVHRRGLKQRVSGHEEEQRLDAWLMEQIAGDGEGTRVTFDDPDLVVDVETVDTRAGVAVRSRERMERFPFLHAD